MRRPGFCRPLFPAVIFGESSDSWPRFLHQWSSDRVTWPWETDDSDDRQWGVTEGRPGTWDTARNREVRKHSYAHGSHIPREETTAIKFRSTECRNESCLLEVARGYLQEGEGESRLGGGRFWRALVGNCPYSFLLLNTALGSVVVMIQERQWGKTY